MDQYYIWSFPGTGKSSVPPSVPGVLDADSRLYQFIGATPRMLHDAAAQARTAPNPEYPDNYFNYIENAGSTYVLLNCHVSLLPRIPNENLLLVYPDISLKDEYLRRYRTRGDNESFLSYMDENFDAMIHAVEAYPCRKLRITDEHTYLTDLLKGDFLMNEFMTKRDLCTLLNESIRYDLLGPEVTGDYARAEDIAQAIFEGEVELDFGDLRKKVKACEKAAEAERVATARRGGLTREELADKLMQGIVNGALNIRHGEISPYSYGYQVTFGDSRNFTNRWECYCKLEEVPAKLVSFIEANSQSSEVFGQKADKPIDIEGIIEAIDKMEKLRITSFTPENASTLQRSCMPYERGSVAMVKDVHNGNGLDGIVQHHFHGDYGTITTSAQNDLVETLVYMNGFCLDHLPNNFCGEHRDFIIGYLQRHGTDITTPEKLDTWVKNNPDKCALPANRARSKPLDSQISGASQRTGIKQNPRPGKEAER